MERGRTEIEMEKEDVRVHCQVGVRIRRQRLAKAPMTGDAPQSRVGETEFDDAS